MSEVKSRSGGYRNDGLRNERDPAVGDQPSQPADHAGRPNSSNEIPEDDHGRNEMSKAWARESYRADYGRAAREDRNDFGRKRVDNSDEEDQPD